MVLGPYPNIEAIATEGLARDFTELANADAGRWRTGSYFPPNIYDLEYFAGCFFVDGASDRAQTYGLLDVDTFARTPGAAVDLAKRIEQWFLAGRVRVTGHGQIDTAEVVNAPRLLPYPETRVTRYSASYRISARR